MNIEANGEIAYQDSIHPPDLIIENPLSTPSFDSDLSTPPDSPHRGGTGGDAKDEEKKEEDEDRDDPKILVEQEEVPIDECAKNDISTKNASKPFDEDVKEPEKIEVIGDSESAPDDEKKQVEGGDNNIDDSFDDPPSLSLVEEAKKSLSAHGLRGFANTEPEPELLDPPSSKPISPLKMKKEKDLGKTSEDEANVVEEPPSLSRVEEAMQRTSMMVLKHTQSDLEDRSKIVSGTTSAAVAKTTTSVVDSNNDIPSTTMPVAASSTEVSPPKTTSNMEDCETSFEKTAAIVSPDSPDGVDSVPADEKDEIMNTKDRSSSISRVTKNISSKEEEGAPMDPNATMETAESSVPQDKSNDLRAGTVPSYRKMTPMKDLQGSDKSAGWLQEELRRRAGVKREINNAIEARGQSDKPVVDEIPTISSPPEMQNSQSTLDEEVAAITANNERDLSISNRNINRPSSYESQEPPSLSKTDTDGKVSRKLEYGGLEEHPHDELMKYQDTNSECGPGHIGFRPVFDYQDIQHEMKKFASETRAALREQSFTDIVNDPSSSAVPVAFSSPISVNRSTDGGRSDNPDFQMNAIAQSRPYDNSTKNMESISINFSALEAGEVPKMLISMDSFDGIASGDIFLSLLSENTGRAETSVAATWADRVHGAIWRARRMRKSMRQETHPPQPLVRGGSQTVASVQQAALVHLKRDEIDDAINLVEGIVFAYYSYFERSLNLREKNPASDTGPGTIDFKPYIGMALHNLGVLNLLKGDYDEALSYFTRAVENRKSNLGEDHPHYISSLVRLAVCRYALNEFAEAHAGLEEALACAKRRRSTTLEGRLQVAEILNNLGCLAYMSGQPTTAATYYRDSMDIQFGALSDSLYLGNATSGQSISLNISIARANIGFIKLVTKDLPVAITALENALMEQQILLKGLNETLIATMDHLALSNLLVGSQEKAALMYNRILTLQQKEYGPNDRRCFVTVEKMNMVQGKGVQYEGAIEELRKTFSVPPASSKLPSSQGGKKASRSPSKEKHSQTHKNDTKKKKKKGFKALTSMMKKNP